MIRRIRRSEPADAPNQTRVRFRSPPQTKSWGCALGGWIVDVIVLLEISKRTEVPVSRLLLLTCGRDCVQHLCELDSKDAA